MLTVLSSIPREKPTDPGSIAVFKGAAKKIVQACFLYIIRRGKISFMPQEGTKMHTCSEFFEKDAFAKRCGVELLEAGDGRARARLVIGQDHLNGVGIVHGAAIFTLADAVFAAASNSHDHVAVAININISYLKAVEKGTLFAQAEEVNRKGKIGSYTITVTDEQENTVALFQGLAYRKIQ